MTMTEERVERLLENKKHREALVREGIRLRRDGMSNADISHLMDIPESAVRRLVKDKTYAINPIFDGNDSSDVLHHSSMVDAVLDMLFILQGIKEQKELGDGPEIYGYHVEYYDHTGKHTWLEYFVDEEDDD